MQIFWEQIQTAPADCSSLQHAAQALLQHREFPYYVAHLRSHTSHPGYLAEGKR
ncbi:Hypothetical predicted protein [Podarcis lilfordi]|uniref:RNase H type-1 domain-containing protein n=1 Tax=Podarcis lilfordi TaxID=74358 RepID=A0AA35KCH9_9SAUR|nr:Hypothetical predicted protein [Podarcis lilfordi]